MYLKSDSLSCLKHSKHYRNSHMVLWQCLNKPWACIIFLFGEIQVPTYMIEFFVGVFVFKLVTSVLLKKILLDERLLLRASRETCTVITSCVYICLASSTDFFTMYLKLKLNYTSFWS